MQSPHEIHWKEEKIILQYVLGTIQFGVQYSIGSNPLLVGLIDSNWVDDPNDWNSTVGYVFTLGLGTITWSCKKQSALALSSV